MNDVSRNYNCTCGRPFKADVTHQQFNYISVTLICDCGVKTHHREGWTTPDEIADVAYSKLMTQKD